VAATSNRYTQVQDVGGTASITHDAAGHIQADGNFTYTYSDRGRMSGVVTAAGTVSYLYNGLNQRVYKSGPPAVVPSGASYYLYDEAGQLLGEYDANGSPIYETIYLGSLPVGALKQIGSAVTSDIAVTLYNVHADHIATPRLITKQDHTIVWRWDTAEAFGATAPDQNPSGQGAFAFNQRFPGQVFDAETGLFQNWNREYNARLGRYIESDPIGLNGGINTFAYVAGNPLNFADPLGLEKLILFGRGDVSMQSAAQNAKDIPGTLNVYAHGNEDVIADDRNGRTLMNPAAAAKLIRDSGLWKPGMPVTVEACNVGKESNGFTQGLANALGVPVTGPNGYLEVKPRVDNSWGFSGVWSWSWGGFHGSPGGYTTARPR
jgi:RHS repeat-associated protein